MTDLSGCAGFLYIDFALTCGQAGGEVVPDGSNWVRCLDANGHDLLFGVNPEGGASLQAPLYPLPDSGADTTHEAIVTP